ncbi:unnamed protein product [Rhodiola kirilowii]
MSLSFVCGEHLFTWQVLLELMKCLHPTEENRSTCQEPQFWCLRVVKSSF